MRYYSVIWHNKLIIDVIHGQHLELGELPRSDKVSSVIFFSNRPYLKVINDKKLNTKILGVLYDIIQSYGTIH